MNILILMKFKIRLQRKFINTKPNYNLHDNATDNNVLHRVFLFFYLEH